MITKKILPISSILTCTINRISNETFFMYIFFYLQENGNDNFHNYELIYSMENIDTLYGHYFLHNFINVF